MLRSAAAAAHAAAAAGGTADPGLRRALRRSRRREQWRAAVLVLPLFAFVLVCFVAPIGAMLARGIVDTDIARILPGVTAALKDWDSRELPPEKAYAALVRRHPRRARSRNAGERRDAAQLRRPGLSHTALRHGPAASRWKYRAPRATRWSASIRNGRTAKPGSRSAAPADSLTDFYLLGALDLHRDADNRSSARRPSNGYSATCSAARCGFRASSR